MTCEQKSGVFLDITCKNNASAQCSNCKKHVCDAHNFDFKDKNYCENCFWENYILSKTEIEQDTDYYIEPTNHTYVNSRSSYSSGDNTQDSGFKDGFGGGEFGGGGASGSWTEGELQSLAATDQDSNAFIDTNETFFYS